MMLQSVLNPSLAGDLDRELTLCLQGMRSSPCTRYSAKPGAALSASAVQAGTAQKQAAEGESRKC